MGRMKQFAAHKTYPRIPQYSPEVDILSTTSPLVLSGLEKNSKNVPEL